MTTFASSQFKHRLIALAVMLAGGYVALLGWLGYWQLSQREKYARIASRNQLRRWVVPAPRGTITDIHGTVLAASRPVKTVCVDPGFTVLPPHLDHHRLEACEVIARELDLPLRRVTNIVRPRWFRNRRGGLTLDRFEVLCRNVPLEKWQRLTNALARLDFDLKGEKVARTNRTTLRAIRTKMVYARDDFQRYYPGGRLAAHVVGFVTKRETNHVLGALSEMRGTAGIEQRLDRVLRGTPGWRLGWETVEPRPGLNVVLTLDAGVQAIVEEELRHAANQWQPRGAVAVVVRPRTGDILAMASYPDFDPARRTRRDMERGALKNWAIFDPLEPGSTMKAITFAAALEDHCFRWEEKIQCGIGGVWRRGARDKIKDFVGHGTLTFLEVLAKSSNIGTAMLAERRIPPARFVEICQAFGLGERTGVPLPGEAKGVLDLHPKMVDYVRMAFGHHVDVTPLQMTMAYAAIANGGLLMRPRLVDCITDANGQVLRSYPPVVFHRAVSRETTRELTRALQEVVSDHGTARRARLALYTVAGKTGTAVMYDAAIQRYNPRKDYSSFVGFFPASRPEICIFVGIIEPHGPGRHGGGYVAAPIWHNIAEQVACYLRIRPDKREEPRWAPGDLPTGLTPLAPLAARRMMNAPLRNYW